MIPYTILWCTTPIKLDENKTYKSPEIKEIGTYIYNGNLYVYYSRLLNGDAWLGNIKICENLICSVHKCLQQQITNTISDDIEVLHSIEKYQSKNQIISNFKLIIDGDLSLIYNDAYETSKILVEPEPSTFKRSWSDIISKCNENIDNAEILVFFCLIIMQKLC